MAAQLSVWPAHRLRLTGSLSSVVHGSLCPLVSSSLLMYIATELLCFPALICLGLLTSVAVFNHVVSLSAPSVYLYAFLNHAFISQCKWWAPAKDFLTCVFSVSDFCILFAPVWHSWCCDSLNLWFRSAPLCICSLCSFWNAFTAISVVCVCVHVSRSSSHTQVLLCFSLSLLFLLFLCLFLSSHPLVSSLSLRCVFMTPIEFGRGAHLSLSEQGVLLGADRLLQYHCGSSRGQ